MDTITSVDFECLFSTFKRRQAIGEDSILKI